MPIVPRFARLSAIAAIAACIAMLFTTAVCRANGDTATLPKYLLPLGRKLTYSLSSIEKGDATNQTTTGEFQLTVVHENPDGSSRVIFRQSINTDRPAANQAANQPTLTFAYADVFPDGRITPNATLTVQFTPRDILPPLPSTPDELKFGWLHHDTLRLREFAFTPHAPIAQEFAFTGSDHGLMGQIYESTDDRSIHFDPAKGMMTLCESSGGQSYGLHVTETSQTALASDELISPDQAAQMATDFQTYFAAQQAYDQKMKSANTSAPDQIPAITDQAKADLTTAAASVKDDELQAQLQQTLTQHDDQAKYLTDQATQRAQMIGQPAPDFSTTDLNGNPVKLSDFHGKVVLMDFWYRGCGWCMFAMPQIKQVARDFKRRPLAVLGMNTDSDEKDARMVIEVQHLNYPTLKAIGVAATYNIHAFPTLIIIDQAGIIRGLDVGYSPTLRDDVEQEIRPLFQTRPAPASPDH